MNGWLVRPILEGFGVDYTEFDNEKRTADARKKTRENMARADRDLIAQRYEADRISRGITNNMDRAVALVRIIGGAEKNREEIRQLVTDICRQKRTLRKQNVRTKRMETRLDRLAWYSDALEDAIAIKNEEKIDALLRDQMEEMDLDSIIERHKIGTKETTERVANMRKAMDDITDATAEREDPLPDESEESKLFEEIMRMASTRGVDADTTRVPIRNATSHNTMSRRTPPRSRDYESESGSESESDRDSDHSHGSDSENDSFLKTLPLPSD